MFKATLLIAATVSALRIQDGPAKEEAPVAKEVDQHWT